MWIRCVFGHKWLRNPDAVICVRCGAENQTARILLDMLDALAKERLP